MMGVIMLSVVMPNVVAPFCHLAVIRDAKLRGSGKWQKSSRSSQVFELFFSLPPKTNDYSNFFHHPKKWVFTKIGLYDNTYNDFT